MTARYRPPGSASRGPVPGLRDAECVAWLQARLPAGAQWADASAVRLDALICRIRWRRLLTVSARLCEKRLVGGIAQWRLRDGGA